MYMLSPFIMKNSKYFRNTSRKALSEGYGIHERRKQYMMVVGRRMSNMKFGIRTPSLKKSISARTTGRAKRSIKKALIPGYGKKGAEDGLRILRKLPKTKSTERRL